MKLGIAVVYLVREDSGPLLDLHLRQIERFTSEPFTIHAAAPRLDPQFRAVLARCPRVRCHDLPDAGLRGEHEHTHYLERLIDAALADGATHIAVFHVDSFPVRPGWATELAGALSDRRPFAAAVRDVVHDDKPFTAFLLARREFIQTWRPTLLLTPAALRSSTYRAYLRRYPHHPDSGVGWGLLAYREGLDWVRLERTDAGRDRAHFGAVHGDTVFHLGAASWDRKDFPASRDPTRLLALRSWLARHLAPHMPPGLRARIKGVVSRRVGGFDIEAKYRLHEEAFRAARDRLLADPDGTIELLRTEAPQASPS